MFWDNHEGALRPDMLKSKAWAELIFFFFFSKNSSLPVPDVCTGLRKINVVSSSSAWRRTTANAACSSSPPAGRPARLSIRRWFDVGRKVRTPPSQQHREGWNIERETGTEEERVEREEPSTDGRPSWWKMAAVFSADYERTALEKTGGSVCDSTQQNREAHAEVKPAGPTSAFWVGDHEKCGYFPLCCLSSHCVCYRFSVSAPHWFLLRPPSHQNPSTSFDLTSEYASHDQTTEDPRQTECLN